MFAFTGTPSRNDDLFAIGCEENIHALRNPV